MGAPRITILTTDVGGGHRSVARSIAAALDELYGPRRLSISSVDFLTEGAPWPLPHAGSMYAFAVTHLRPLWRLAYRLSDGRRRARLALRAALPFYGRRTRAILRRTHPDLVVACHPLASAAWASGLAERRVHLVVAVSDLTAIHALWVSPTADLCLVPTEIARRYALSYGMPSEKLQVVGLPVHPAFARQIGDRGEARRRWGLSPERFTTIISGGGEGMGPLERIAESLDDAALPLQLVLVCGRNQRLRRRMAARGWRVPALILGFVDTPQMAELLRLSDCQLTKAGPSSIAEALVTGTPTILTGFVPGPEQSNVAYVVEAGAGLYAPTPQAARQAVERFLADASLRQRMSAAARAIARPEAAHEAARRIAELLGHRDEPSK